MLWRVSLRARRARTGELNRLVVGVGARRLLLGHLLPPSSGQREQRVPQRVDQAGAGTAATPRTGSSARSRPCAPRRRRPGGRRRSARRCAGRGADALGGGIARPSSHRRARRSTWRQQPRPSPRQHLVRLGLGGLELAHPTLHVGHLSARPRSRRITACRWAARTIAGPGPREFDLERVGLARARFTPRAAATSRAVLSSLAVG